MNPAACALAPMQRAAYAAWEMATELSGPGDTSPVLPSRLGIAEAAARLGVSPDTVRRRIKRGQLQAVRDNSGRLWLTLPPEIAQASPARPRQAAAYAPMQQDVSGVVDELRNHISSLRSELVRAHDERDRLLALLEQAQEALARRNQGVFFKLWDRLFGAGK